MDSNGQFVFATCQLGAEAALKSAIAQLELDPEQEPEVLEQARRLQQEVERLRGLSN